MVVYLIPVKHPDNSYNYNKTWQYLCNTLASICRGIDYHVVVCCNKMLPMPSKLPSYNITIIKREAPPIQDGHPTGFKDFKFKEHMIDKTSKRLECINYARRHLSPTSYVLMDADDYVSDEFLSVAQQPHQAITLLDSGILMSMTTKCYTEVVGYYKYTGSGTIVDAEFLHSMLDYEDDCLKLLGGPTAYINEHPGLCSVAKGKLLGGYCLHDDNHGAKLWKYDSVVEERGEPLTDDIIGKFAISLGSPSHHT